jgi:NAD(P)-dependent dehydrogenase (short-subunit alcohol dehydrogenase family)
MAPQPSLNTEVYAAIHPKNFISQFKGKLVVVTGAGRGIGRHISLSFARAGATLALLDLDVARQAETKSLCEAQGATKVSCYACDVTKYEQCDKVLNEIGLDKVDVLVNNAGGGPIRGFTQQTFEEFWGGVELNFKGVWFFEGC